jgi:hypothetical protein
VSIGRGVRSVLGKLLGVQGIGVEAIGFGFSLRGCRRCGVLRSCTVLTYFIGLNKLQDVLLTFSISAFP